ncbi:LOW QUALITY PROTEIN: hypothetical protein Cgig2_015070 [Carnegiea gigantea]|uniref:Uncharacterized protein n=1 Tax=Carnegiea gigantea TaxID=171969 RepID=A0A9Q1QD46_9CARY|nr:LOW QUALITY PROTEIN: hypothetical protein Cgig2_015070 [Carnegiea gigantea]
MRVSSSETNSLQTSKGEVSISLLDIHGFLRLPFLGFFYDEVVPLSKELKTGLGRSCTNLFAAYHILQQCIDHKLTIKEWITLVLPVKYHAPMKSDHRSQVPLRTNVSLTTDVHVWNESHVVFDQLGVPKSSLQRLSLWLFFHLCLFILLVKDASCIHPMTFLVVSSMERAQVYYPSLAILTSIYRGLGEICCSAHLERKGGHIP